MNPMVGLVDEASCSFPEGADKGITHLTIKPSFSCNRESQGHFSVGTIRVV
jgi:hypothetical protein